jgi:phosphoribosylformylglycinamidine synthase
VIGDIRKAISVEVKEPGNLLYLVGYTYPELGGSQYYQLKGFIGNEVPKVRIAKAKVVMQSIEKAITSGYVRACHDLSDGGLAVAAAEMAFSGNHGISLHLNKVPCPQRLARNDTLLFSESPSRFLVEVSHKHQDDFEATLAKCEYAAIGRVEKEPTLSILSVTKKALVDIPTQELRSHWKKFSEVNQ